MYAFLEGDLVGLNPTIAVVMCAGIGFECQISLNTFQKIKDLKKVRLFTHLSVKEDAHTLFGFADENERELFRHLISVNGVGPSTARMVLSSLSIPDITSAIIQGNVTLIKGVKGIGPKTAQRIILELQDKLAKGVNPVRLEGMSVSAKNKEEASTALQMLGFSRIAVEKVIREIAVGPMADAPVEELIKIALKKL